MPFLLQHSVARSAERFGEREAFRCDGQTLTYAGLAEQSNRLANFLVEHGVTRGDRVGILMHKGLELPVAIYGILAAGGAYVPLDPAAPAERVRFLIEDCGLRHLVVSDSRLKLALSLAESSNTLRCVVGGSEASAPSPAASGASATVVPWSRAMEAPSEAPSVHLVDDDLAYIMVTSGSTGTPKGLMHTHRSGRAYAELSAREYGVRPDDRLGNHSPLHFDMSTFEYLTGPLVGSATVIIPEEVTMFPRSLAELIERERLTFWYSVPLALIQLLLRGGIEERDLSSLRWVLFGGEPFPAKHLARLTDLWPHARFSNSYGPAEVNQCTAYHLPAGPWNADEAVPIGRVWDGAQGLVLDDEDREVSAGEPGELVIRAPTMMSAYWRRPDLNAKAFFFRPRVDGLDETFYRTGDLVSERADGELMFLGRRDRQVKVRGYRVELDEVESVVGAEPGVAETAVICVRGRRDGADDSEDGAVELIAVVLPRDGAECDAGSLQRAARARLPGYAVPARFEIVTELPRTGTGKIDRRALAEQYE